MNYHIVIAGDWRVEGGICVAVDHEIRALKGEGYKIGLLSVGSHFKTGSYPLDSKLAQQVRAGNAVLVSNTKSTTRLLCVRHPAAITDTIRKCVNLKAEKIYVIVDGPPINGYGQISYDAPALHCSMEEAMSTSVEWVPVSPVCRDNLKRAFPNLPITDFDWVNFVFIEDWRTSRTRPLSSEPTIGRHSRPSWEKFPDNRKLLLAAYPPTRDFNVRFLGAGNKLKELVETWPPNWTALEWNTIQPQEFLRTIDFFVYFHHSAWVESFGRTIIESLASGCVAIVPPYFKKTFGDAAIYAQPEDVKSIVTAFQHDWKKFKQQSFRGYRRVMTKHNVKQFLAMVRKILSRKPTKLKRSLGSYAKAHVSSKKMTVKRKTCVRNAISISATAEHAVLVSQLPTESPLPENRMPTRVDAKPVEQTAVAASGQWAATFIVSPSDSASVRSSNLIRPSFEVFDIVFVLDFGDTGDSSERVAEEIEIARARGCRIGVIIRGDIHRDNGIEHPFLNGKATNSFELILDFNRWIAAQLAIIISPKLTSMQFPLRFSAERVLVIADQSYRGNAADDDIVLRQTFGAPISWAATTFAALDRLEKGVQLTDELWTTSVIPLANTARNLTAKQFVIGYVGSLDQGSWPSSNDARLLFMKNDRCVIHLLGAPFPQSSGLEPNMVLFDRDKITLRAFISKLDVLIFYPASEMAEVPLTAISLALTAGIPVILPSRYTDQIGRGPNFLDPVGAHQMLTALCQKGKPADDQKSERSHLGLRLFGPQQLYRRLAQHEVQLHPEVAAPAVAATCLRIIMFSANGVGLGHVSRQLSIARRFSDAVEPVFVTLNQGVPIIRQFGYVAEYIPSLGYTKADASAWDKWLEYEIGRHIDFYGAGLVAFDGNSPPTGLLRAVASRHDVKSAWIRRAMWQQPYSALVSLQKYFDMVIEPAEIAGDVDKGATVSARPFVIVVPPIRLLDHNDLLSREEAALRIGFDPSRPAVLLHLGSGSNRDNTTLIDQIMEQLVNIDGLQIAIVEWETTDDFLRMWPGTTVLHGFPISQYFAAFDFSISAAGYNTFHEVISFALPTIFIPNSHPSMDDQRGRAEFAERHGAAITLLESDIPSLATLLPLVVAEKSREFLKLNCSRLALDNGAEEAARLLESLLDRGRGDV